MDGKHSAWVLGFEGNFPRTKVMQSLHQLVSFYFGKKTVYFKKLIIHIWSHLTCEDRFIFILSRSSKQKAVPSVHSTAVIVFHYEWTLAARDYMCKNLGKGMDVLV